MALDLRAFWILFMSKGQSVTPPFSHSLSHTRTHARLSLSALLSLPGDRLHLTSASLCLHSALGCVLIHKELWSKLTKQCKVQNRTKRWTRNQQTFDIKPWWRFLQGDIYLNLKEGVCRVSALFSATESLQTWGVYALWFHWNTTDCVVFVLLTSKQRKIMRKNKQQNCP